ncbi:MAG TPA: thiamine phosphate synthase, partial [Sphingomicrobium sp.]|nr:thiamine phosphate synthase [Sphingomicrobium sp.]
MAANQPQWPREWLMTDERIGDRLWEAIGALPPGAGVVFRHYGLGEKERLALGQRISEATNRRGLQLAVAGSRRLAEQLSAALVHNPQGPGSLPASMAVHDERQAYAARNAGAVLVFVAPIFPTQSHPGAPALGPDEAADLARLASCPAIALGG